MALRENPAKRMRVSTINGHRRVASVWLAVLLATTGVRAVEAQPDPALAGVCYATLGNNAANPGALVTVDLTTGAGTLVGATGIVGLLGDTGVPALAIRSNGEMYATDIGPTSRLYRLDATTGAATLVATTALASIPAIAFDGADVLWAVDNLGKLYFVDTATGASTLVGESGVFIKGLAFDPTNGVLWGTDAAGGVFTLDVHSGAATLVGNTGLAASPDIHFDSDGNLYGSSGGGLATNNLISIDKVTGTGAVVGSIGFASVAGMASRLDRLVPVALQAYESSWTGERVEIAWRLAGTDGAISFDIERTDDARGSVRFDDSAVVGQGQGSFLFIDDAVERGATYRYHVVARDDAGAVASFETRVSIPALASSLGSNYPNPFSGTTAIPFSIGAPERVSLDIYDVAGRRVRRLIDLRMHSGTFVESWDGRDDRGRPVPGGVYFYRLTSGTHTLTKKLVLVK